MPFEPSREEIFFFMEFYRLYDDIELLWRKGEEESGNKDFISISS